MKNFSLKSLVTGKGLAVTVGVCLAVVGAVGVYSYTKLTNQLNQQLNTSNKPQEPVGLFEGQQVGVEQKDVERPSATQPPDFPDTPAFENQPADDVLFPAKDQVPSTPDTGQTRNQTMVRPVNGEVLNSFSGGDLVKSKTLNVWKTHDGVDIAGDEGEKVKSMTAGTVLSVTDDPVLGVTVVIDHGGGLVGHYSNLSKDVKIAEGDVVSAGAIIGAIGNTAESEVSELSHLHFAVMKNDVWIDPIALISGEGS